jgi:hypothetical protein
MEDDGQLHAATALLPGKEPPVPIDPGNGAEEKNSYP